jgi:NAD(P)-dependent dehydrogenase (short-subunit alcohol dehydrogenase family)
MGLINVVITGASRGIGRACALELDRLGLFRVFAGVRTESDAEALKQKAGGSLTPVLLDITKQQSIQSACDVVCSATTETGLNGLVNNAGIAVAGPLEFTPIDELRRQFEVNVIGQIAVTQSFLPLLRKGVGRIVNIGSMEGLMAMPFVGPYCSSKFAMEALTDSLRMELKPWSISVSIVEPGIVRTQVLENSIKAAEDIVQAMPERAYGLYAPAIRAAREVAVEIVKSAMPPDEVIRAIIHALTARKAKTRYIVGRQARLAALAGRLLPDRLRDLYLCREMGLVRLNMKEAEQ